MRWLAFILLAAPAHADMLVAARTIRSHEILSPADVAVTQSELPGALTDPEQVVGMEARVVLYAGRPIRPGDIGPAAVIERNAIVTLVYVAGGLLITTEGRALDRAGPGDTLRVMNLTSRLTVSGQAAADGSVYVTN